MTATSLGSTLQDSRGTLDKIAGVVIIALGLLFVITPFVPRLNREWRPDALISRAGSGGPLIAGAAFAFAWTPCVGPTLGAILTAASVQDTVGKGALLLACYSAGLAVPFMLTADRLQPRDDRLPLAARPLDDRDRHLGGRADRDGRAAADRRADAAQRRGPERARLARAQRLQEPVSVLVLDIGSSSVRSSLWDEQGGSQGEAAQLEHQARAAPDGTAELDPEALLELVAQALDAAMEARPEVEAVAISTMWHSLLGLDGDGQPLTPVYSWADRRAAAAAAHLRGELDEDAVHQRTGCRLHSSYWPAKLAWLRETDAAGLRARANLDLPRRVRAAAAARRRGREHLDGLGHRAARPADRHAGTRS